MYMTQKRPKSFGKKLAGEKVPQKFQNSWGVGVGVRPGLENTQIKAAFFFGGGGVPYLGVAKVVVYR